MKKWADKKRRIGKFQVRDLMLVKMYSHARLSGRHWGLIRWYEGPFPILKKVGAQAYKVELPPKIKYHYVLKPYHGDQVDLSRGISRQAPMGMNVRHKKEVEEVLADRVVRYSNHRPMNSLSSGKDYQRVKLAGSLSNTYGNSRSRFKPMRTRSQWVHCQIIWKRMSRTTLEYSRMPWISLDLSRVSSRVFRNVLHKCRVL